MTQLTELTVSLWFRSDGATSAQGVVVNGWGTGIGWGKIRVEHAEAAGSEIRFSVDSSPFAEEYGHTDHAVCHFLTGALTGLGRVVFGADAVGEETACLANGAERCEFRVGRAPSETSE